MTASRTIRLITLGRVDLADATWLAHELHKALEFCEIEIAERCWNQNLYFDSTRGQYRADEVLDGVDDHIEVGRTLVLIDADLYVARLNFVFGLAQPAHQRAIVALPRLRESFYGRPDHRGVFEQRLLKEAVHELGHTYGLDHCVRRECVMHFSNTLADTDFKPAQFCAQHAEEFQSVVGAVHTFGVHLSKIQIDAD